MYYLSDALEGREMANTIVDCSKCGLTFELRGDGILVEIQCPNCAPNLYQKLVHEFTGMQIVSRYNPITGFWCNFDTPR